MAEDITNDKREALVLGNKSLKDVTDDICELIERPPGQKWFGSFYQPRFCLYFISV